MAVLAAAVVLAAIANVVVCLVITTALMDEPLPMPAESPPPESVPRGVVDVVLFSLVVGIGAGVVYAKRGRRPEGAMWEAHG